jgi:hypothetical protein
MDGVHDVADLPAERVLSTAPSIRTQTGDVGAGQLPVFVGDEKSDRFALTHILVDLLDEKHKSHVLIVRRDHFRRIETNFDATNVVGANYVQERIEQLNSFLHWPGFERPLSLQDVLRMQLICGIEYGGAEKAFRNLGQRGVSRLNRRFGEG